MKQKIFLHALLFGAVLGFSGCGKVAVKGPVFLPGFNEEKEYLAKEARPEPLFENGDIVRYKMLGDKRGIVIQNNYEFLPKLNTWYCVVDFYPSSAAFHFDFSEFDNYERRYVYEYELELVKKYSKKHEIPARWRSFACEVQ